MSNRAGLTVLLTALVVLSATGGVAAFHSDSLAQVDVETDTTSLNVALQSDGTATWEIVYRVELDDENTTQAFEDLAGDVETTPSTYLDPFRDRMTRTAAAAENATGREMAIRNVSLETRRESQPQVEYGLLVYRFEWTNFATVDGERLAAGDAIDQFFLDGETTLRLSAPDGYAAVSTTPDPTRSGDGEVVWEGRRDFDAGEPRVVFSQSTPTATDGDGAGGASGGDGAAGDGGSGNDGTGDGGSFPTVALVALVVFLAASAVWVYARRGETGEDAGAATAAAGGEGGGDDTDGSEPAGPPPELLSNEERVLRLLEDNGGRMKQKAVAEQLDWTDAKTSQVVGDLREDEKVESFRLGRENVLTLPDVELEPSGDGES